MTSINARHAPKRPRGETRASVIALRAKGLTQEAIAALLGVSQAAVSYHLHVAARRCVVTLLAQGATVEQIGAAMRGGA